MAKITSTDSLSKVINSMIKEERNGSTGYTLLAKAIKRVFPKSNVRTMMMHNLVNIAKDEKKHQQTLTRMRRYIKNLE